jgi:predicted nucleotidyltransferase
VNLDRVAIGVARDLKEVVFVGAFAVICHVGPYRSSQDINIALATPLGDNEFEALGYRIFHESGKKVIRTPEGVKLDVYTRDVSGIMVSDVFRTAITKRIRRNEVRVMGLEALLIAKMRASRPQDIEDLHELCRQLGKTVKWNVVNELATPEESAELKNVVLFMLSG